MGSEWEIVSLDQVANMRNGAGVKQDFFADVGVPLARVSDFTTDSIDLSDCNFVESEHAKKWSSHLIAKDDVIVATVGSWPPNWSSVVGKVVRAPISSVGAIQNQNTCCVVPDEKRLNNSFLYYRLKFEDFAWHAANSAGGSANQARLPVKKLGEFRFNLPSLEEQEYIAQILSSLDNKITLNRQLNQTLEQMAQALFKSWFVDFDPVIDNALAAGNEIPSDLQDRAERRQLQLAKADHKPLPENIRKLFPSEFELTESLGWVPLGWGVTDLKSLSTKISKGTTPTKSDLEKATDVGAIPFLKVKDISSDGKILHGGLELIPKSISEGALKRSILEKDDLLISIAGSIGRTSVVQKDLHGCNCNQALAFIRLSDSDLHLQLVKLNIQGKRLQDEINSKIVQAVQANFSLTQLGELKILMSSGEVLHSFNASLKPIQLRLNEIEIQSRNLEQLRDTLLPKLISGELRIPEAQAQLEAVLG
ncbi:MAG TPA: restriction endonuclease subunit S [Cellvibrio sp.]|nr:restriction endonuclease subunit S [Cellvibrio sp.]